VAKRGRGAKKKDTKENDSEDEEESGIDSVDEMVEEEVDEPLLDEVDEVVGEPVEEPSGKTKDYFPDTCVYCKTGEEHVHVCKTCKPTFKHTSKGNPLTLGSLNLHNANVHGKRKEKKVKDQVSEQSVVDDVLNEEEPLLAGEDAVAFDMKKKLVKALSINPQLSSKVQKYVIDTWDATPIIRKDSRAFFEFLMELNSFKSNHSMATRITDTVFGIPEGYQDRPTYTPSNQRYGGYRSQSPGPQGHPNRGYMQPNDYNEDRYKPRTDGYYRRDDPYKQRPQEYPVQYQDSVQLPPQQPKKGFTEEDLEKKINERLAEERDRWEKDRENKELRERIAKLESGGNKSEMSQQEFAASLVNGFAEAIGQKSEDPSIIAMKAQLNEVNKKLEEQKTINAVDEAVNRVKDEFAPVLASIKDERQREHIWKRAQDDTMNNLRERGILSENRRSDTADVAIEEIKASTKNRHLTVTELSDLLKTYLTVALKADQTPSRSPNDKPKTDDITATEKDELRKALGDEHVE